MFAVIFNLYQVLF